jgi:large subunit ribosomal protein L29
MASETLKEYRKMAADQLAEREAELRTELFKLRTEEKTDKAKDTSRGGKIKRNIARILTIKREQETKKVQA